MNKAKEEKQERKGDECRGADTGEAKQASDT